MKTTQQIPAMISAMLSERGISKVIASPGSRDMPLLTAFATNRSLEVIPVLDERSAAFYALGISEQTGEAVALVCTSGSALLNYAPAVAEAYYRNIRLIILSADRPTEAIGQNRGQTLVQDGALANVTVASYDINGSPGSRSESIYANRCLNDALNASSYPIPAPVHINVHFQEPLYETLFPADAFSPRTITRINPDETINRDIMIRLADKIRDTAKVMIFAGQHPGRMILDKALSSIGRLNNIAILSEHISNLHSPESITSTDALFSESDDIKAIVPDLLICYGGGPTSRKFKETIETNDVESWYVGTTSNAIDCFNTLSTSINISPEAFFQALSLHLASQHSGPIGYKTVVTGISKKSLYSTDTYINSIPWGDIKAISMILKTLPDNTNLQSSNGMTVRYLDLFDCRRFANVAANRGVNGIDGSISTAIGSASQFNGITVLLCGDLSARYDVAALINLSIPEKFKIVIFNNGGGDIFRCIRATRNVTYREQLLCMPSETDWPSIAKGAGMTYYFAYDSHSLQCVLNDFIQSAEPSMLVLSTASALNSQIYINYINRNKRTI